MNILDEMRKKAEIQKMISNTMEKEVLIEERKLEIERIKKTIGTYEKRIKELETDLELKE